MILNKILAALPSHYAPKPWIEKNRKRFYLLQPPKRTNLTYSKSTNLDTVDKALHQLKSLPAQQSFKVNALMLCCSYIPSYIANIPGEILHNVFSVAELFENHTHSQLFTEENKIFNGIFLLYLRPMLPFLCFSEIFPDIHSPKPSLFWLVAVLHQYTKTTKQGAFILINLNPRRIMLG